MVKALLAHKPTKLLLVLTSFFVANALIAESIGTKLFSLERTLGLSTHPFSLFGQDGLSYVLTCGVILWPLEFVLTDVVNEYFGSKAVRRISFIAIGLISYAFLAFYFAIHLPADTTFWTGNKVNEGVPDQQAAFSAIFGQGMNIIVGSLVAFLVSQLLDAWIFQKLKKATNGKHVWLRATGSTLVSQLIDSFIVLAIAFGPYWGWQRVLAIGLINYSYKAVMALLLTPLIYLMEARIDAYLGKEIALEMKKEVLNEKP